MITCDIYSLVFGFLIGLLLMSVVKEEPTVVVKYPTPFNTTGITYVDNAGQCYQYQANKLVCPVDNSLVEKIPVQI